MPVAQLPVSLSGPLAVLCAVCCVAATTEHVPGVHTQYVHIVHRHSPNAAKDLA